MADVTISDTEYAQLKADVSKYEQAATAATERLSGFEASFGTRLDAVVKERDEAKAALTAANTGFEVDRTLMSEGITDSGIIDYLRFSHGNAKANDEGAKPTFGDWYKAYAETKPSILAHLNKPDEKTKPKETPAGGDRPDERRAKKEPVVDNSQAGAQGNQREGRAISPQDIAQMSPDAFKTYVETMGK